MLKTLLGLFANHAEDLCCESCETEISIHCLVDTHEVHAEVVTDFLNPGH